MSSKIYHNEMADCLLALCYPISKKSYKKSINTSESSLNIINLGKIIGFFYKKHQKKVIAISALINSSSHIIKLSINMRKRKIIHL